MRTLDQGETAAVERQHPPIGPTQPVALLDLRIAKAGFAGDPRADLCKFRALQGLQQIARIGDATALLAGESLIEQHFRRARSAAPVSDPIPVGAIVSGALATRCRSNHVAPTAFGNASRFCHDSTVPDAATGSPPRNAPRDRDNPARPAMPHRPAVRPSPAAASPPACGHGSG
jgi:hypothetical protein